MQDRPTITDLREEALDVMVRIRGMLGALRQSITLVLTHGNEDSAAARAIASNVHANVCAALRDFARRK